MTLEEYLDVELESITEAVETVESCLPIEQSPLLESIILECFDRASEINTKAEIWRRVLDITSGICIAEVIRGNIPSDATIKNTPKS